MQHLLDRIVIGRYAVEVRLTAAGPAAALPSAGVVDLIWAHAVPGDRLDHVMAGRSAICEGEPGFVVFLRADDTATALDQARKLCDRSSRAPALRGRRLTPHQVIALTDVLP